MGQVVRQPALSEAYAALERGDLYGAVDATLAALPEERRTPETHMSGDIEAETGDAARVELWLDGISPIPDA